MQTRAVYFSGATAVDQVVDVFLQPDALYIQSASMPQQCWHLSSIYRLANTDAAPGIRLASHEFLGSRLTVAEGKFGDELMRLAPQLHGSFHQSRASSRFGFLAACIGGLALVCYVVFSLAPQQIAKVLPTAWKERVGTVYEANLVDNARQCHSTGGDAAMTALLGKLAEGNPDMPPIQIKVYDIPIANAFTLPGGHIVVTRGLLEQAKAADQVAGVIAHEIGHAALLHPEAQLVRVTGLQILMGVVSASSHESVASTAGMAAILRSSREAETDADTYAMKMLEQAHIDPLGLRRFFEWVLEQEGHHSSSVLSKIEGAFATHPGTADRIERINPLPADVKPVEVLTPAQWTALQAFCK
jgi:Zn-dependent protease with chaperone function